MRKANSLTPVIQKMNSGIIPLVRVREFSKYKLYDLTPPAKEYVKNYLVDTKVQLQKNMNYVITVGVTKDDINKCKKLICEKEKTLIQRYPFFKKNKFDQYNEINVLLKKDFNVKEKMALPNIKRVECDENEKYSRI